MAAIVNKVYCVRAKKTHNRCDKAYAIKYIFGSSHQTLFERTLTVNNKAQKRPQAFIQIIFHCHISSFFYLCRVDFSVVSKILEAKLT